MKGTLHKTNRGWVVKQLIKEGPIAKLINQYPLHPDAYSVNGPMKDVVTSWEGQEVEFEIVANEGEPLGRGEQPYKQYAKLIDDDLSDWDVTLTDGLEDIEWGTKQAQSPKEKAEELVNQFNTIDVLGEHYNGFTAQQCALIAVNECIELHFNLNGDTNGIGESFKFWNEVKEEIEKL
jgi:hypothetical protein